MINRVTWFAAGAAAGAVGAVAAGRKVKQAADSLKPVNVARGTVVRVKARGRDVAAAVREGRAQARAKETELKAARDGKVPPDPFAALAAAGPGTTVNYIVVSSADVPGLAEALGAGHVGGAKGPRRTARRAR